MAARSSRSRPKAFISPPISRATLADAKKSSPHYHGHRDRLRARFAQKGVDALADYELLELYLFRSIPRRDVKPTAKELIAKFGSFAEVIAAPIERLTEIKGISEKIALDLKILRAAATKLGQDCLLYTSPSPRDRQKSRMPSSA